MFFPPTGLSPDQEAKVKDPKMEDYILQLLRENGLPADCPDYPRWKGEGDHVRLFVVLGGRQEVAADMSREDFRLSDEDFGKKLAKQVDAFAENRLPPRPGR
jgi:hypothetical protein